MAVYLNGKKMEEPEIDIILMFRHPNDKFIYPEDYEHIPYATSGKNDVLRLKMVINLPDGKGEVTFDSRKLVEEVWLREHIMKRCPNCKEMYIRTED